MMQKMGGGNLKLSYNAFHLCALDPDMSNWSSIHLRTFDVLLMTTFDFWQGVKPFLLWHEADKNSPVYCLKPNLQINFSIKQNINSKAHCRVLALQCAILGVAYNIEHRCSCRLAAQVGLPPGAPPPFQPPLPSEPPKQPDSVQAAINAAREIAARMNTKPGGGPVLGGTASSVSSGQWAWGKG